MKIDDVGLMQILDRLELTKKELYGLCDGSRQFTMRVPVHPSDSDITIQNTIDDVAALVDSLREAQELIPQFEQPIDEYDGMQYCLQCGYRASDARRYLSDHPGTKVMPCKEYCAYAMREALGYGQKEAMDG